MDYRIAICDDSGEDREYISSMVREWAARSEYAERLFLQCFSSAEEFLFKYEDDGEYDILLLDIEMKELSGMQLAKKLREENCSSQMVFITGFSDYIAEGYDVSALHYLMKPLEKEKLFSVLDRAAAELQKPKRSLVIQSEGDTVRLFEDDVQYVEAFSHTVAFVTSEGSREVRQGLSETAKSLSESFVRCHRSYLVNLKYISRLTKDRVVLDSGKELPLSRGELQNVRRAFVSYYKKED